MRGQQRDSSEGLSDSLGDRMQNSGMWAAEDRRPKGFQAVLLMRRHIGRGVLGAKRQQRGTGHVETPGGKGSQSKSTRCVSVSLAAITNTHRLGMFSIRNLSAHNSRDDKPETEVSACEFPLHLLLSLHRRPLPCPHKAIILYAFVSSSPLQIRATVRWA